MLRALRFRCGVLRSNTMFSLLLLIHHMCNIFNKLNFDWLFCHANDLFMNIYYSMRKSELQLEKFAKLEIVRSQKN